jgi:anaerobic nitric oxide reductase transcription regulator
MSVEGRKHRRVPARVEVELVAPEGRALGVSTNVSIDGLGVRVAESDATWIARGLKCTVSFSLGVERLSGAAQVTWVTERVARNERTREFGLTLLHQGSLEALTAFVDSFRFRAVTFGLGDSPGFCERLESVAQLSQAASATELEAALTQADVGLLVVRSSDEALIASVAAQATQRGVPVIAVVQRTTPPLSELLMRSPRLFCQVEPVDATALAALSVRILESTTQSEESDRLMVSLERELKHLRDEKSAWRSQLNASSRIEGLLGGSGPMQRVADDIERLAGVDTTVLILGETGTGKGVVARALHHASLRAKKPLITQNCAALPESLLDSELFGHVRGSFTGAVADRAGIFESADGGTIFLDELTEMSAAMQAKLLTVLQDGEFRRVGSAETRRLDVRVLCASNRPLEPLVERGLFREDLYYRLAPFVVRLPPLRARREDIAELAAHVLTQFRVRYGGRLIGVDLDAMALLEHAPWPGNVRQLQHALERLAIGAAGGSITAAMVEEALSAPTPRAQHASQAAMPWLANGESLSDGIERFERALITEALQRARFVISDAAAHLKVNRSTLSRRIRQLGIRLGPGVQD